MESYKIDVTEMSEQDKSCVQKAAFKLGYYWSNSRDNVTNLQAGYYYLGRDGMLGWDWARDIDSLDKKYGRQITLQQLLKLAGMEGNMTTKQFSKKDLKDGMVVRTKDGGYGDHYLVIGDKLLGNGHCDLSSFEEDLTCPYNSCFDIMEVYSAKTTGGIYKLEHLLVPRNLKSIWQREEKSATQIELEKLQKQIADLQAQANKLQSTL